MLLKAFGMCLGLRQATIQSFIRILTTKSTIWPQTCPIAWPATTFTKLTRPISIISSRLSSIWLQQESQHSIPNSCTKHSSKQRQTILTSNLVWLPSHFPCSSTLNKCRKLATPIAFCLCSLLAWLWFLQSWLGLFSENVKKIKSICNWYRECRSLLIGSVICLLTLWRHMCLLLLLWRWLLASMPITKACGSFIFFIPLLWFPLHMWLRSYLPKRLLRKWTRYSSTSWLVASWLHLPFS